MNKRLTAVISLLGAAVFGLGAVGLISGERLYAFDEAETQEVINAESQSSTVSSALFGFRELNMTATSLSAKTASLRAMTEESDFEGLWVKGSQGSLIMNKAYLAGLLEQAGAGDTIVFSLSLQGSTCVVGIQSNGNSLRAKRGLCIISVPYKNGTLSTGISDGADKFVGNCAYFADGAELRWQLGDSETYTITAQPKSFTDSAKHWAKNQIEFLAAHNVLNGVPEGGFRPNRSISRAEFVTILARLSGEALEEYETSRFRDVLPKNWFYHQVNWATERGIVNGKSETSFAPEVPISREEMAVLCDRFMNYYQVEARGVRTPEEFADAPVVGSWALPSVERIQAIGVINGKNNNIFDPRGNASRAEATTMLSNLISYLLVMPH